MTTPLDLPVGEALRSDPVQYLNLANDFEERRQETLVAAAGITGVGANYIAKHSGPDIETISDGLKQIADAYRDRVSSYEQLAFQFRSAYDTLRSLEDDSDDLDYDRSRLREIQDGGDISDEDHREAARLVREFDGIRRAEKSTLESLSVAITNVKFGNDISYNAIAWTAIINRAALNVDPDSDLAQELTEANMTIANHADGGDLDEGFAEELSEQVTEARINEQTSEEAGLPAWAFPADYDKNIERLRDAEKDDDPNIPFVGGPNDADKAEAARLREVLGLSDDPQETRIQVVSDTANRLGTQEWKGEQLGEVWLEPLNSGQQQLILEEITGNTAASVPFFNTIGPQEVADSPHNLGPPLAEASHEKNDDGTPALIFTGRDVIEAGRPRHQKSRPPEILFLEGDFDTQFLADATTASIERKQREPRDWRESDSYDSDPTNILLDRAAENPEAVSAVVESLKEDDLVHLLVDPPFAYNSGIDDSEPITEFLAAAGADSRTSAVLLEEATKADNFSDPGVAAGFDQIMAQHAYIMYDEKFLEDHDIDPTEHNGISQEQWEAMGLDQHDWSRLQEKVHEHGQGLALVAGNDALAGQAIANDIEQDGRVNRDYTRFGLTSGVLERNYIEARLNYQASIDADSEAHNRLLSTGRSTALFATGLATGGTTAVAAGIVDIYVGHYSEELGIGQDTDNEKTELSDLLEEYLENPVGERYGEIARVEAIRAAQNQSEPVFDYDGNEVRVVETGEGPQIEVRIDGDWQEQEPNFDRNDRPENDDLPEGVDVGEIASEATERIGPAHTEGVNGADPDRDSDSDKDKDAREAIIDADVWAPPRVVGPPSPSPPIYTVPGLDEAINGPDQTA